MNLLVMSSEIETSLDFLAAKRARDPSTALRSARNDNRREKAFELRASSFIRHSLAKPKLCEGGSFVIRHYV